MPRLRGLRAVALAACVGLLAAATSAAAQAPVHGPDVASYQHPQGARIDWQRVHDSGAGFAFVKATEGTTYTNPYFAQDYAGAHAAGLARSAYHYARPQATVTTARDQADFFVRTAGTAGQRGDLPLTLDLEETGGLQPPALVAWTQAFVDEVRARTNRPVVLYTYPYFWQHAMGDTHQFSDLPLWIASYRSGGPKQPLPGGWKSWTFWQYTSDGRVPGISGATDESTFAGSAADLATLADPVPAPGPGLPVPLPTPPPVRLPKP